jgi:hypothetical protein
MQRMIQRLHIHGHAFDLVLYKPLAGFHTGAARIVIVLFGVVEFAVHARVQADHHALELFRLDVRPLAGILKMLGQDQAPGVDLDFKQTASPVYASTGISWV